jgi:PAS domain S-box-containing protein
MESVMRLLLLEDSEDDAQLILHILMRAGHSFESEIVSTRESFIESLKTFHPDVVLSDHKLPNFSSTEALAISHELFPSIPFILVTGTVSEEFAASIIKDGADDYILKNNLMRLPTAVTQALDKKLVRQSLQKAQHQLIQNEKRFRTLIENSEDMLMLIGRTGMIGYVSPAVERNYGLGIKENTHHLLDITHPDDLKIAEGVLTRVLQNPDVPMMVTFRNKRKDATYLWVEGILTNRLEVQGVQSIVANFRDITARKEAEQQREFDRNNLKALINNTKDWMWSVDRNFRLITCNQPFDEMVTQMTGQSVAPGHNILLTGFSDLQLKRFFTSYERAFAGEVFTEVEYMETPFKFWSEISYYPIRKGNEIIGTACHARDITSKKKAEISIQEDRILLRTLIDNLPLNVYSKDIHSRKTLANRADYEFMGAKREEDVLGKVDSEFFSKDFADVTRMEEERLFKTGEAIIGEEEHYLKRGGKERWFLKSKIPFRNKDHQIIGLVGISYDITERKEMEAERLKYTQAIEGRNTKLREIAWIQSHGVRAPLARMMGLINLLQNHTESEGSPDDLLDYLIQSARELDGVIREIVRKTEQIDKPE